MIIGDGIRLRAIEAEDLQRYVSWLNDPEVARNLDRFLPLSLAEERRWFEGQLEIHPVERAMAIETREADHWIHIGGCGLHKFDKIARHAELGIFIGEKTYWGRGLGSQALALLLAYAFETLNLNRVHLRVLETNARARKVYQRLGFKGEGRLRKDRFIGGEYVDTLIMAILKSEWLEQREATD